MKTHIYECSASRNIRRSPPYLVLQLAIWMGCFDVFASAPCISTTPFGVWMNGYGVFGGNGAGNYGAYDDNDGDGLPNFVEWAYNLPPQSAGRPTMAPDGGTNGLPLILHSMGSPTNAFTVAYIRRVNASESGVGYRVETSVSPNGPWLVAINGDVVVNLSDSLERVVTSVQKLGVAERQQFCRLVLAFDLDCPALHASIYDIRSGLLPSATRVRLSQASVTGIAPDGFYFQVRPDSSGYLGAEFSGVFVQTGTNSPSLQGLALGMEVEVEAVVNGNQMLDQVVSVTATGVQGPPLSPLPVAVAQVATGGFLEEVLQSVVVKIGPASLTVVATGPGQFTVSDGLASIKVSQRLFNPSRAPTVGQTFSSITGILGRADGVSQMQPRSETDLQAIRKLPENSP